VSVELFTMVRVWAAITGLVLAIWGLLSAWFGVGHSDLVPMLVAGIGGFEIFLTMQDAWARRRAGGSRG
jgi:hypothetical protein